MEEEELLVWDHLVLKASRSAKLNTYIDYTHLTFGKRHAKDLVLVTI